MPNPGEIQFPPALDTLDTLIRVNNNALSTLTGNISVSDLLIPVADPGKFPDSGIVTLIDSLTTPTKIEIVHYTSKGGSNLVVPASGGRGQQGSTAFAFSIGNFVDMRPTALHHAALAQLLLAIEAKLGIGADTPGGSAQALLSDASGASLWRAIVQGDISGLVAALADKISKTDAADQTIVSNLVIQNTAPKLSFSDVGQNDAEIFVNGNLLTIARVGQTDMVFDLATGVVTFGGIPLLPGFDPTLDNQATRKIYVDTRRTKWAMTLRFIEDPNLVQLGQFADIPQMLMPPGEDIKLEGVKYIIAAGSGSGSFAFDVRSHNGNTGGQTTHASVSITGATPLSQTQNQAITPAALSENHGLYIVPTSRTSPAQRAISIVAYGSQQVI